MLNEEFKYQKDMADAEEPGSFAFRGVNAADNYTAALLKDGTFFVWGMNDRGQMGIGSGMGTDLVESESNPKELDFKSALPEGEKDATPVMIQDFSCGMNTMLMRDHKNRVYKTGLKLDYTPKLIKFNAELLPPENIK